MIVMIDMIELFKIEKKNYSIEKNQSDMVDFLFFKAYKKEELMNLEENAIINANYKIEY